MSERQLQTLLLASLVVGGTYIILSDPRCERACRTVFEPLASEAGKILASTLAVALIVR
ncbi:MAG: hypothetical protein WD733_15785 [Bryobacterales bacterium]